MITPASAHRDCRAEIAHLMMQPPRVEDPTWNAKLWQPLPQILVLIFRRQGDVARTFLRFQEHYESPHFRQAIFTLPDYVSWYRTQTKDGRFSYYEDWSGFNFPSSNLTPFLMGKFDPLHAREQWLLDVLRPYRNQPFYLVATSAESLGGEGTEWIDTLRHEFAHAFFFLDSSYRTAVREILATIDREPIERYLAGLGGYHDSVLEDETHAYLLDGRSIFRRAKIDPKAYAAACHRLATLFETTLIGKMGTITSE